MDLFFVLLFIPSFIVGIEFIGFLATGRRLVGTVFLALAELGSLVILPFMYANFGKQNECCGDPMDTATFSPDHQISMWVVIILALLGYFYSRVRNELTTPILEVLVNICIAVGTVLGIVMMFHAGEAFFIICGALPVPLLGLMMLAQNHRLFMQQTAGADISNLKASQRLAWRILSAKPFLKFPILVVLCLPVLVLIAAFLVLFGQKPDSFIRAFTDTYKHGLSQWDYKCANVQCGGHYLCSVAAKGHPKLVKPQRLGTRHGGTIVCNRQLLVSNAFEDLLQEKLPRLHRIIRRQYNKVGELVHRHYHFFNIKLVSDIVYFLMKPLEWLFILALYIFDRKPENRIAKQYLKTADRIVIQELEKSF